MILTLYFAWLLLIVACVTMLLDEVFKRYQLIIVSSFNCIAIPFILLYPNTIFAIKVLDVILSVVAITLCIIIIKENNK